VRSHIARQGAFELNVAAIEEYVGAELGVSKPLLVTQAMIDSFADVTGDRQWIHVDRDAAKRGPYGTTIAHGYLTLSLLPQLARDILKPTKVSAVINYGTDRVRFPRPLPVDSTVRARAVLSSVERSDKGVRLYMRYTIFDESSEQVFCVADIVTLLIPEGVDTP